jgi:hypothetical protein
VRAWKASCRKEGRRGGKRDQSNTGEEEEFRQDWTTIQEVWSEEVYKWSSLAARASLGDTAMTEPGTKYVFVPHM